VANVEGFPVKSRWGDTSTEVRGWLSDNDAAEEVTVEALGDVCFTPGAAAASLDAGVCRVVLCDASSDAAALLREAREHPERNPAAEHWVVPLEGSEGVSEGDHGEGPCGPDPDDVTERYPDA
jgi:hypothetical protein